MKKLNFFAVLTLLISFFLLTDSSYAQWQTSDNGIYYIGKVGIGLEVPNYDLDVNGTVHTSEVVIDQTLTQPDYVFEDEYILKSIYEVEKFIKENKHLPDIPSANEVDANGVKLGEMNTKLLLKIEELTLYAIDLKKQNTRLQDRFNKLLHTSK